MPRVKKIADTQTIQVSCDLISNKEFTDMTAEAADKLQFDKDVNTTLQLDGKTISLLDFVMYVEDIAQRVKPILPSIEQEILKMFLEVMSKHALVVGREIQSLLLSNQQENK